MGQRDSQHWINFLFACASPCYSFKSQSKASPLTLHEGLRENKRRERWWHLEWYTVSFDKCHISESIRNTARMQALEQQWVDAKLKWHMDKLDKGQEN